MKVNLHLAVITGCAAFVMLCTGCSWNNDVVSLDPVMTFAVFDVGQGLSQAVVTGNEAVVFDAGPEEGFAGWEKGYVQLGRPYIRVLALSHSDADHRGALALWDSTIAFSGEVAVNSLYDTALIRAKAGWWHDRLTFAVIGRGDTIRFSGGVVIGCLNTASDAHPDTANDHWRNNASLRFRITHGVNSVLITSDIDTGVTRSMAQEFGPGLASDIMMAPHHGSAGSFDPVFFGLVNPRWMIISCSESNTYGHPSVQWYPLAFQMHSQLLITYKQGTVLMRSNGHYWQ